MNTLILAWPDFVKPNDEYIEKYANVVSRPEVGSFFSLFFV